ncbi:hypothetical protein OG239_34385 [Streptomyces sp. NBC_00868]|uniref:hypothetical protein n=1 Tax=unclassified Streptomyces TaxID=2593676 RepID=UPI00324E9B72|nr:hypothetical protein OG239_34385 [Streptomyces sp. NBC_00868]
MTRETAMPPLWFRLPPGFHDIRPEHRAALDAVAQALGSPDAQRELTQLMDGLDQLVGYDVVHTAIGMHPDEPTGVCTSLFSLTTRPADHANPRVAVARTALGIARSNVWDTATRRFIDLPSSLPCYLVAGAITLPRGGRQVFQARIATSHPAGLHVLVLDLTTAAIQYYEAYTDILEAVAHTLTFTDPNPRPPGPPTTSRLLEVLL